ncbi:sensor histidine kinase [Halosegnis longus]|uniref:Sensor histidine kinase n=1 Tax=Halosegnis longus TaxID=2216012 RepID=A0AAJ4R8C4_9EURY|nr:MULTISPECIES: HAMP domain-containing sensor histidine kinase [Halobacteriales]RNJ26115.1 sensor histidine kinase [Salella cibi]
MEDSTTDMWSRRWVAAIGVGFLGALALELLAYRVGVVSGAERIPQTGQFLVGVATTVGVAAAFIVADLRLTDRRLFDRYGGPIVRRIIAGGALFLTVNVVFLLTEPGLTTAELFGWLRWATVVGSGAGLVVGLSRARAIQNAVEAERNAVRADMLESQRDVLTYLNSLLRHEVLNGTNVITGYAKLLEEVEDPDSQEHEHATVIRQHSEDVAGVIQNIKAFLTVLQGETTTGRYDVAAAIPELLDRARELDETTRVEYDGPQQAVVRTTEVIDRALWNLVSNAVEHTPAGTTVRVCVDYTDAECRIAVVDDGDGIDPETRATLFERPESNLSRGGFGLYLTKQLIEAFDGTIAVETDDSGTTATVTLPVPDETDGSVDPGTQPGTDQETESGRSTATVE